jgi:5'-nucleotidase
VLRHLSIAVVVLALLTTRMTAADRMQLTILHTNDIHGHITSWRGWDGDLAGRTMGGFDRLATAIARVRGESKNVLLLDAGDATCYPLVAGSTEGKAVMNL